MCIFLYVCAYQSTKAKKKGGGKGISETKNCEEHQISQRKKGIEKNKLRPKTQNLSIALAVSHFFRVFSKSWQDAVLPAITLQKKEAKPRIFHP